jgi:adenosylhomocysteine nucleosidase
MPETCYGAPETPGSFVYIFVRSPGATIRSAKVASLNGRVQRLRRHRSGITRRSCPVLSSPPELAPGQIQRSKAAARERSSGGGYDLGAVQVRSVVAVTGLAFEARVAGGVTVVGEGLRSGGNLQAQIERGSCGVISFGIAGGLAPGLVPGQWVVASAVISDRDRHIPDAGWSQRLLQVLPGAVHATIFGIDAPIADGSAKRDLHHRTGAAAVDMESHLAARVAAAHGLPFTACRVVVDPAHRDLPPAALVGLRADGTADVRAVLRSVLEGPRQLPQLMRLMADASIAFAALRRGRGLLGPALGFPEVADFEVELVPALS